MKPSRRTKRGVPEGGRLESSPILWGFDGELAGNESRVQGRLPFFRLPEDQRVYAARTAHWSLEPLESLTVFGTGEEAQGFGTRLELQEPLVVSPGQLVVLFGPAFVRNLHLVDAEASDRIGIFDLPETSLGFRIVLLAVADFEKLAQAISSWAKVAFDREIHDSRGEEVSARAAAALALLRNTGFTPAHDQMIRTLLAERLRLDPDAYRKSLKLGAVRLEMTAEALEADADRHLRLLVSSAGTSGDAASEAPLSTLLESQPLHSRVSAGGPTQRADARLMKRIAAGDREALGKLFEHHASVVFGLLFRILRRRKDAEEVLQEVFLQAVQQADRFDPGLSTLRGWLLALARSRALDRLRRDKRIHEDWRRTKLFTFSAEEEEDKEGHRRLQTGDALDTLLWSERNVAIAFFEGLTQTEISNQLEVPTLGEVLEGLNAVSRALRLRIGLAAKH